MKDERPFFSILLPTRNRADLLVDCALQSVLNSSFNDFEIVVCDNGSTDNTGERVKEIKDPHIRYIRSSEWIPKEHFFEFAFRHARGKFSMIFCDDDYLTTEALKKAHHILSKYNSDMLVYSPACTYHFPNWYEPSRRNILRIPTFDGKLFKIDSKSHLKVIFERMAIITETPMVTDVFYRTSLINSLIDKYGTIFPHGHMGDYNIAAYTLSHTPYYLFLYEPLTVFGHWKENTSEQLHFLKTTMPEYQEWIDWITNTYLSKMPVKTYQWQNCVAACLTDMKNRLGLPWDINITTYFYSLIQELFDLEIKAVDVSNQKEECCRVFKSLSSDVKGDILKAVKEGVKYFSDTEADTLNYDMPNFLGSHSNPKIGKREIRISGDDYNFNTILEAGRFYEAFLNDKVKIRDEGFKGLSSDSAPTTDNYLKGISLIARQFNRVCIIGSLNAVTRMTVKRLDSQCVYIADVNPLLKGTEIMQDVVMDNLGILSNGSFDCVVITSSDSRLSDDAPYKFFSEFIKKTVEKGKSNKAVVFRFEDIVQLGSIASMLEMGSLDVAILLNSIVEDGEELVKKGELDKALEIFSRLLDRLNKARGVLMNDIAVINIHNGNLDKAEEILNKVVFEGYALEDAEKNLKVLNDLKKQI